MKEELVEWEDDDITSVPDNINLIKEEEEYIFALLKSAEAFEKENDIESVAEVYGKFVDIDLPDNN